MTYVSKREKNKRLTMLISGVIAILIIIVSASMSLSVRLTNENELLKDQSVENLIFKNAQINYENNVSKLSVEVENEKEESQTLKYIKIILKDENEEETTLIGYIGEEIESKATKEISASIDKDITKNTSMRYEIVR